VALTPGSRRSSAARPDDHADLVVLLGGRVDAQVRVRELVRQALALVLDDLGGAADPD